MISSSNDAPNTVIRAEFSPGKDPFEEARQKGPIRWIIAHILHGRNKLFLLLTFLITTISSTVSSQVMIFIGLAINDFTIGDGTKLGYYAILILIFSVAAPILDLIKRVVREILAIRVETETRHEFYTSLIGKSQSFHDQQQIGDIMARTTSDVRMLNFLVSPAVVVTLDAIMGIGVPIFFIFRFYPAQLLISPILFAILFLISVRKFIRVLGPVSTKLRYEFGQMNAKLAETLSGVEVVKGSTMESFEHDRFMEHVKGYRDAFVDWGTIQGKYLPLLLVALTVTVGLSHAILLYNDGILDIGQIIAYVGLLGNLRFPTTISVWVFSIARRAVAGSERLLDLMNKETEIDMNVTGVNAQIEGRVKFEKVSFAYPGSPHPVLRNITFEVQPGQTVAIVGKTGSAKTTLTKLISRLYDANEGQILIDGINVREFSLQSLRSQISYIEQDIFLFDVSIFENITFGRTSSMEDVIAVAKEAQAHDFISTLSNGYETIVGERGVQLSGGERQRVAIARAFLTDPRILILDDSTSAIDSETEDKIQQAIRKILRGRTTFLITHRLSQIRWADLIIVLKQGEIAAIGTHEELLKTSEEYQNIFVKRFDMELPAILVEEES